MDLCICIGGNDDGRVLKGKDRKIFRVSVSARDGRTNQSFTIEAERFSGVKHASDRQKAIGGASYDTVLTNCGFSRFKLRFDQADQYTVWLQN